jgi:hypothetical protein
MILYLDNYRMDPWAIAFVTLVGLIVVGGAGFYFKNSAGILVGSFSQFIYYIPVALLLFGAIADVISQTFKFSIGSFVGVSALTLNGLIGRWLSTSSVAEVVQAATTAPATVVRAARRVADAATSALDEYGNPVENNPFRGGGRELCSFPGLQNFDNKYAPQNILVTTAIMFYYMIGEWDSGNALRTVIPGISLLATVLSQTVIMYSSGCLDPWWSPFVAIAGGIASGGIGYGIVKAVNKNNLPFIANQSSTTTPGGFGAVEAPTDVTKPADGSKCAEASGDDFVCDLYKNGELITTTVSG